MRNINEFNIPPGDMHGYEILYFGVNLILMFDYRLSFNIEVIKNSDGNNSDKIEVLIINRKDVPAWKKGNNKDIKLHYSNSGERINDIFKPSASNAYAFILSNRTPHVNNSSKTKNGRSYSCSYLATGSKRITIEKYIITNDSKI